MKKWRVTYGRSSSKQFSKLSEAETLLKKQAMKSINILILPVMDRALLLVICQ
jgi:hypothetical protein